MANSKCKKKARNLSAYDKAQKEHRTYRNKLARMERQVRNNPGDHVAIHNLAMFRAEGMKAKGFAG
jgi:hypothetical protein